MHLKERLEVEVRYLVRVLRAEDLRELGIRDDVALEAGIEASVLLDVRADVLRYLDLRALGGGRETHEGAELIGDGALLEECILGTARIVTDTLLGGEGGGVNTSAALGGAGIALDRLGRLLYLADKRADTGGELAVELTETILEIGDDRTGSAGRRGIRRNYYGRRRRYYYGRRLLYLCRRLLTKALCGSDVGGVGSGNWGGGCSGGRSGLLGNRHLGV